ncbi:MAG: AAA family ATPase [Deltaproteobacteria bacterium]|jgi:predicted ATPase|nr:AAA family ATPase [Deltaproteobacteria bacterium]
MSDLFITNIYIEKLHHLENVEISLSDSKRKHLILTGKNGSGKTIVLEAIKDILMLKQLQEYQKYPEYSKFQNFLIQHVGYSGTEKQFIKATNERLKPEVKVSFSKNIDNLAEMMFAYIPAFRTQFRAPTEISKVDLEYKTPICLNASQLFPSFMLQYYIRYLAAKDSGAPTAEIESYAKWFNNLENALREIFNCPELKLIPHLKDLLFYISMPGRPNITLLELADGYRGILNIFMELILRFDDSEGLVNYEQPAVVVIDELAAHLHVELQRRVLPFLAKMFPNAQFIVSTHSPFVMTSLSNSLVFDLESLKSLENPSFYSINSIVESFLGASSYSDEMVSYFNRYKELSLKERTKEEDLEFQDSKAKLDLMSLASSELFNAYQQLSAKIAYKRLKAKFRKSIIE